VKIVQGLPPERADWPASAVTIGKFDGVHAGHRAVIVELERLAERDELTTVVVTFDRHPLALLAPERSPSALVSIDQKLDLLAETGVDATVVLEFTPELAALEPEDFVRDILVNALHARHVLVGRDFRFGHRGAGDVRLLRELGIRFGFTVALIADVGLGNSRRVSSTWIRELLCVPPRGCSVICRPCAESSCTAPLAGANWDFPPRTSPRKRRGSRPPTVSMPAG
jgi:riboflavin kinase/FMN adenylyltransferase